MLLSNGSISIFWSNALVTSIMSLAMVMLFWPLISRVLEAASRRLKGRAAARPAE
jgi:putative tricarboxylic transport membrane protein